MPEGETPNAASSTVGEGFVGKWWSAVILATLIIAFIFVAVGLVRACVDVSACTASTQPAIQADVTPADQSDAPNADKKPGETNGGVGGQNAAPGHSETTSGTPEGTTANAQTGVTPIDQSDRPGAEEKPDETNGAGGDQGAAARSPGITSAVPEGARAEDQNPARSILFAVLLAGIMGGLVHSLRSFFWYAGNRQLRWSWVPMYFCLPLVGGGLALIMFFVIQGKLLSANTPSDSPYMGIGIAGLVGLFSDLAAWKLRALLSALLGEPVGKDSIELPQTPPTEGAALNADARGIIEACEAQWEAKKEDSGAFVRAVANAKGIADVPEKTVDEIIDYLTQAAAWWKLAAGDDAGAKRAADSGKFVIGGLKSADMPDKKDGLLVVIVAGEFDPGYGRYPHAYWGRSGRRGKKNATINYAYESQGTCDKVVYFVRDLP